MTRHLGRRGSTTAEFAIALSSVLMLLIATTDLGGLLADQHAIDFGVEQAIRYAAVNSATATTTTIKNSFVSAITSVVGAPGANGATVTVSFSPSYSPGGTVTVSASMVWSAFSAVDSLPQVTLSSSQTLTVMH